MKKELTLILVPIIFTSAYAGVAEIKAASPRSNLISDIGVYKSNLDKPGFMNNELGGEFRPQYYLNNMKGELGNVDISNARGAPSINLTNTQGTNSDIRKGSGGTDGSGSEPTKPVSKWHVVYSGSGRISVTIPSNLKGYSSFKASYKYTETRECYYSKSRNRSITKAESTSGTSSGSKSISVDTYYCNCPTTGSFDLPSSSMTLQISSSSAYFTPNNNRRNSSRSCPYLGSVSNAYTQLGGIITRLEVYK